MTTTAKPAKTAANDADAMLRGLTRHHQLVTRLLMSPDTSTAFGEVLSAAIEITHADAGTLELWDDAEKCFRLAAQSGFDAEAVKRVHAAAMSDGSPHRSALDTGRRVVVEDLGTGLVHAGGSDGEPTPHLRAVQSTPLLRRGRGAIGVVATYYGSPHRPSGGEAELLDLYARQAADFIDHLERHEAASFANRRKDEFLALLAHELRSPLAPLSAGLELLRTTENDAEVVHEVHQIMQRQLDQLTALIHDVFDISCITRGVFSMKSRRIDIDSVVTSAAEQLSPAVRAAGHQLTVELPDRPIFFDGDPRRIVQVLANLLDNAIKFTPRGGTIRIVARRDADALIVSVEDSGIGIPPTALDGIFEPAGRGGGSTPAAGIGLSLVKSLIELHGGTVSAHSAGEGRGATFTIRLPAAAEGAQGEPEDTEMNHPSGLRILVVDDNGPAADMLAMILESYGNEVSTAYSGEQGIELAETLQPDVILLDIGMPAIDGHEAARRIRRQPGGKEPTLIALTGWGDESDKEKARNAGFDHYVVKPTKAEDLRPMLSEAKRRARRRQ